MNEQTQTNLVHLIRLRVRLMDGDIDFREAGEDRHPREDFLTQINYFEYKTPHEYLDAIFLTVVEFRRVAGIPRLFSSSAPEN